MANEYLAIYLNDHLAGAVVAIELVEHLAKAQVGADLERFFADLRADITDDRRELAALMARLLISESLPRKLAAGLAETFTELKLRIDDPAGGPLRLLEGVEAVALGIDGKRALWLALSAAAENASWLQGVDYARLEQRAAEQRARVETVRLQAAKAAFTAAT